MNDPVTSRILTLVAGVFITLIVGASLLDMFVAGRVSEAIKNGADPIKAACAIRGFSSNSQAICAQAATRP